MRLVEALDEAPFGSWMDAEAVLELESMKEDGGGLDDLTPFLVETEKCGEKMECVSFFCWPFLPCFFFWGGRGGGGCFEMFWWEVWIIFRGKGS